MPRPAAPGQLALVQAFVNSLDVESGEDAVARPAQLREWLRERDLLAPEDPVDPPSHARALAAREALRALILANNGEALDPAAIATLNDAAARACSVSFDADGRLAVGSA